VRLRLDRSLPLRIGDRALLRDPGSRRIWGVAVLDPEPPALRRRGAAASRAHELAGVDGPDLAREVARRGPVEVGRLRRLGVAVDTTAVREAGLEVVDGRLVRPETLRDIARDVQRVVAEHEESAPLENGLPLTVLADRLGLPSAELVRAAVAPPLRIESGRVTSRRAVVLPAGVQRAVDEVRRGLEDQPFAAPDANRLRELGLDDKGAAAAAKAGLLLRPAPGVVLLPGADRLAAAWLAELPQPFTTSEARSRLGTSRRVVLPLLGYLDRQGLNRRLPDDRREVVATHSSASRA
jgi:selenocysteine-specific elongation factor